MDYRFTPDTLKQLLKLLYEAALAHPSNNSSVAFPVAEVLHDGTFGINHAGEPFERDNMNLSLSE